MPDIKNHEKIIYVDTTDGYTECNLPANPYIGEEHLLINQDGTYGFNVKGNTKTINGLSEYYINSKNGFLHVSYNGIEWRIIGKFQTNSVFLDANSTIDETFSTYFVDLSGGPKTITMPANPNMGDRYTIKDMYGNASTNNLTISGNGNNLETFSGTLSATHILNQNFDCVTYEYNGFHWSIV